MHRYYLSLSLSPHIQCLAAGVCDPIRVSITQTLTQLQAQEWGQRLFSKEEMLLMSSAMPAKSTATSFCPRMLGRTLLSVACCRFLFNNIMAGTEFLVKHCNKEGIILY